MSSSASLTSGWSGRSSMLGGFGSAGVSLAAVSIVAIESGVIDASNTSPAWSAVPSWSGVVPYVIISNLDFEIPEINQTEGKTERGARIRRDQTTSFVAAGRGATEAEFFVERRKHL